MNLIFALIVWYGQTAARSAFEVASIKEMRAASSIESIQSGQFHIGMTINGTRADYGFMSLADLIPYAYRVKRYQLSGPAWMNETRWDIVAKIPEGQPADRAPDMMENLLRERFKLSIHRENREQSVYVLVVGKGGLKIKEAAPEEEAVVGTGLNFGINIDGSSVEISSGAAGAMRMTPSSNGGVQLQIAKLTMAALADRLTQFMARPVVDATGLKGNYQVALDLPIEAMSGMPFAEKLAAFAGLGSVGASDRALEASDGPIIKSVKNLGLELQSRKVLLETIIVDRLEKTPTAN